MVISEIFLRSRIDKLLPVKGNETPEIERCNNDFQFSTKMGDTSRG